VESEKRAVRAGDYIGLVQPGCGLDFFGAEIVKKRLLMRPLGHLVLEIAVERGRPCFCWRKRLHFLGSLVVFRNFFLRAFPY